MTYLDEWNELSAEDASAAILPCCGSQAWAHRVATRRPLASLPELLAASDAAWWSLTATDRKEAFDSHPRIGERHALGHASPTSLAWSAGEQSSAMLSDADAKVKLTAGNRAYEEKFGLTFIVCANGKSAQEILAILERRMHNTEEAELHEAAEQQREITHIRLQKWLAQQEEDRA